jgi:hypothetical protein
MLDFALPALMTVIIASRDTTELKGRSHITQNERFAIYYNNRTNFD